MPAHAALVTYCDGTAGAVTVPNDLVVAAGKSCDLTGTVIEGNVTVRAGANLTVSGTTVQGDLRVQEDGFVAAEDGSTFDGRVVLRGALGAHLDGGSVDGAVNVQDSGFYFGLGTEHGSDVRSRSGGETFLEAATVAGDVVTRDGDLTDIYDSTISGAVIVDAADEGSVVCASEVDGNLVVTSSAGVIQIGSEGPYPDCGTNYVGGDLRLTSNTADSYVSGTIVRGNLACADSDPAPVGQDNRVRGRSTGQCAELAPPPASPAAERQSMSAHVDDRTQVKTLVTSRVEAAKAAAALSGDADLVG